MRLYFHLHLLVFLLATTAILGELLSLTAVGLVLWRTLFAALGATAWVTLTRALALQPRPRGARANVAGLRSCLPWPGWRATRSFLIVGLVIGVHWICFFGAIKLSNVSVCLAGMATISLFTAFTEPLMEKRRIRPFEVLLGLLVVVGIVLVAGFERGYLLGLLVAILSAFLAAIFPVLNRKLVTTGGDPLVMVVWEMAGAFTAALCLYPWVGEGKSLFVWQRFDWLWILLLAWVCTVFAHSFHIRLLRHLSAYTTNLAFNLEPVWGILMAALLFKEHEQLHPLFYAGIGTILLANALHPLILRKLAKPVP